MARVPDLNVTVRRSLRVGDDLLDIALLIWLSVAVGPWWVGLVLFLGAWVLNLLASAWVSS